ncbi:MAG: CHASE3 domain-containing protein [Chthoniobacterales bacterium]
MMKRATHLYLLIGFLVALLLLSGVALVNWRHIADMQDSAEWVRHTEKVREAIHQLQIEMQEVETGMRGFVITGDETFLEPYEKARGQISGQYRLLRELTRDNPAQQKHCAMIEPTLFMRVAAAETAVTLRKMNNFESARDEVATGPGNGLMRQIYNVMEQMDHEEEVLLVKRSATAQEATDRARHLMLTGTGLSFILLIAVSAVVVRENRMRQRSELALKASHAELESSVRANRLIMKHSLDVICTVDKNGKFIFVSEAAERLWGYKPQEMAGRSYSDFVHPEDREKTRAMASEIMAGKPVQDFENRYTRKDGSLISVVWSATWSNEDHTMFCVARDLTARKESEAAIAQLNEELIHRATQLEETNKELEAFSYSVSHDLRSPLRGIDGFSQALEEDYAATFDDEGRGYLARIRGAARRMGELIDDLLKLSQITRAGMYPGRVDLTHLAETIRDDWQRREPDRQVQWDISPGMVVEGDLQLLRVALENLIGNAWKFTSKQPAARIECGSELHDGRRVYYVRDNGAGFDMTYAKKLFGAFQRLHSLAEFEGTGIGLATVQRIMHRHSGRVWAEGAVGQGATFYFCL